MQEDLAHKRPFLFISLILGLGYAATPWLDVPGLLVLAWKGAAIAALGLYALHHHHRGDYALLALSLFLLSLAAVLEEVTVDEAGIVAISGACGLSMLFARYRRAHLSLSQKGLALALLLFLPVTIWLLTNDFLACVVAMAFALMAGFTWCSAFSRYRSGIGALALTTSVVAATAIPQSWSDPQGYVLLWLCQYLACFVLTVGTVQSLRIRRLQRLRA